MTKSINNQSKYLYTVLFTLILIGYLLTIFGLTHFNQQTFSSFLYWGGGILFSFSFISLIFFKSSEDKSREQNYKSEQTKLNHEIGQLINQLSHAEKNNYNIQLQTDSKHLNELAKSINTVLHNVFNYIKNTKNESNNLFLKSKRTHKELNKLHENLLECKERLDLIKLSQNKIKLVHDKNKTLMEQFKNQCNHFFNMLDNPHISTINEQTFKLFKNNTKQLAQTISKEQQLLNYSDNILDNLIVLSNNNKQIEAEHFSNELKKIHEHSLAIAESNAIQCEKLLHWIDELNKPNDKNLSRHSDEINTMKKTLGVLILEIPNKEESLDEINNQIEYLSLNINNLYKQWGNLHNVVNNIESISEDILNQV